MKPYDIAMKDEVQTPSAAVSAAQVLGKLHGLIVDKSKTDVTTDGKLLVPVINVFCARAVTSATGASPPVSPNYSRAARSEMMGGDGAVRRCSR